jgi:hypothetical protein
MDKYPKLREEIAVAEDERGILSLLSDQLIDLDSFQKPSDMRAAPHAAADENAAPASDDIEKSQ